MYVADGVVTRVKDVFSGEFQFSSGNCLISVGLNKRQIGFEEFRDVGVDEVIDQIPVVFALCL